VIHKFILTILLGLFGSTFVAASTADIESALMNKDYKQVRSLANDLLKNTKDVKEKDQGEYYLGLSQLRLGEYKEAKKAFQVVMSTCDSQDLYDRASLGFIESQYLLGSYWDALKSTDALLKRNPQSTFLSLIYLKKARIHLKLTQWNLAKENLQKVITDFPQSLEAPIAQGLMEEKEYFTVQVGSFVDQDRAIRLMEELKLNGQYAYIVEIIGPENKKFYRVRVGQMTSLSDAQSLESKLVQLGYPTLIYP
jgi:tetratricopeptide (TPR) repeat protein